MDISPGAILKLTVVIVHRVNHEYDGIIQALYFYEWRDNLHHAKIWNVESSPIHTAFGLCDHEGNPKVDIKKVIASPFPIQG